MVPSGSRVVPGNAKVPSGYHEWFPFLRKGTSGPGTTREEPVDKINKTRNQWNQSGRAEDGALRMYETETCNHTWHAVAVDGDVEYFVCGTCWTRMEPTEPRTDAGCGHEDIEMLSLEETSEPILARCRGCSRLWTLQRAENGL